MDEFLKKQLKFDSLRTINPIRHKIKAINTPKDKHIMSLYVTMVNSPGRAERWRRKHNWNDEDERQYSDFIAWLDAI